MRIRGSGPLATQVCIYPLVWLISQLWSALAAALRQGKRRLREHDFPGAIKYLREANRFFSDPRITVALIGLRAAPRLTAWGIGRREIQRDSTPSNDLCLGAMYFHAQKSRWTSGLIFISPEAE